MSSTCARTSFAFLTPNWNGNLSSGDDLITIIGLPLYSDSDTSDMVRLLLFRHPRQRFDGGDPVTLTKRARESHWAPSLSSELKDGTVPCSGTAFAGVTPIADFKQDNVIMPQKER